MSSTFKRVFVLCLCMALAGIMVSILMLSRPGPGPISASFLHYSVASDGTTQVAVLRLTNSTGCPFELPLATERASVGPRVYSVRCEFSDRTATGWTNWIEDLGSSFVDFPPGSSLDVAIPLAQPGVPRKVAFLYIEDLQRSASSWDSARGWLKAHLPARFTGTVLKKLWYEREFSFPMDCKPTLPAL